MNAPAESRIPLRPDGVAKMTMMLWTAPVAASGCGTLQLKSASTSDSGPSTTRQSLRLLYVMALGVSEV
jgi:hypothetical protein